MIIVRVGFTFYYFFYTFHIFFVSLYLPSFVINKHDSVQFSSVQSLSHVGLFATP